MSLGERKIETAQQQSLYIPYNSRMSSVLVYEVSRTESLHDMPIG